MEITTHKRGFIPCDGCGHRSIVQVTYRPATPTDPPRLEDFDFCFHHWMNLIDSLARSGCVIVAISADLEFRNQIQVKLDQTLAAQEAA